MSEEKNGTMKRSHLTVKEVAERWGVSVNYVRRLVWDGKLAHTRFGRAVRVSLAAVEDYADRNTVERPTG